MMLENRCFIDALVAENEKLRLELHHRVRNNLAVVAAALRAEARKVSPDARDGFEAAIDRVMLLAREHADRLEEAA